MKCGRPGCNSWVRKIPWRGAWLPTPVFLLGEFHGQRSLASYSPGGCKESHMTERQTPSLTRTQNGFELFMEIRALISKSLLLLLPWSLSPAAPTALPSVPILGPPRDETSLSHLNLCRPYSRFLSPGLTRKTQVRKAGARVLWRLWAKWLSQEFNQHGPLSPGSCKMQTALVNARVISQAGDRSL